MSMNEMKNGMLEDAALEGVSGGAAIVGNTQFSGKVAPENCTVGQSYYVVQDNTWYYAELQEISFRNALSGGADRYFKLHTTIHNGLDASMTLSLNAAQISMYTTMVKDF